MSVKILLAIAPLSLLAACGWVDNTGRDANAAPVTQISFADGQQLDASSLDERASMVIKVSGSDVDGEVNSYAWSEQPVEQGALQQCAGEPDFDMALAADSLAAACGSNPDCRVTIDALNNETNDNDFLVSAPVLAAPVGVTYELTATDNEGGTGKQRSTFCLIAINEAPDVNDDSFDILEGTTRTVTTSERNLLTNDAAHEHVSNQSLRVLTEPEVAPRLATSFSLGTDGSFTYEAALISDRSAAFAEDTFEYAVTDGIYENATATVTIRILAQNDPPSQLERMPTQTAVAGVDFESDLSVYFEDPEGTELSYAIVDGSLPSSGGLTLSATGQLTGTATVFDEGSYPITISVSDGSERIESDVMVVVADNLPVAAQSIELQPLELGDTLSLDVSDYFTDPESQILIYTVGTTYRNASLDMDELTGVLSATFTVEGRYAVDVLADDGVNTPTSIRFVIDVTSANEAPVFRGQISDKTVNIGNPIDAVVGVFFDPNGDDLTYTVIGTLPDGLSISDTGVLSGIPTQTGSFRNIRIVASDPFSEFARSNPFAINVVGTLITVRNTAPVFVVGSVGNQGITLGQPITPVRPRFTDAENDQLIYSITGNTLPAGVVLDPATGVISGIPRSRGRTAGLRVVATDPAGAVATSSAFWIIVR